MKNMRWGEKAREAEIWALIWALLPSWAPDSIRQPAGFELESATPDV